MKRRGTVAVAAVCAVALFAGGWASSQWWGIRSGTDTMADADAAQDLSEVVGISAPDLESGLVEEPWSLPSVGPAGLSWGPSARDWDKALETARAMTVEEAAGQVIVASVNSPSPQSARTLVSDLGLGGVIIMGDAVTDADGVVALTTAIRKGGGDRDWGTIVSVDQEGGIVARLAGLGPDLPNFMAAGAADDKDVVTGVYEQAAVDMRELGFTVDYAPVADVTIGPADPTIGVRSAGSRPDNVSETVDAAVAGYLAGGVIPVIKHFPGHGSVKQDSHLELPTQSASLAELEERDLVPFAHAVEAGAPAVMMAHIRVPAWGDAPASLSPEAHRYLRDELGFDGVIVTDALNMGAVQATHGSGQAAVAALAAGADILLMPPNPTVARDAIVEAVASGEVPRERLDEAAARVILLGRWQREQAAAEDSGVNYGRELAVAGATVAAADCSAPFVSGSVRIVGGSEVDRAVLSAALEERGVSVGDSGTTVLLTGSRAGSADVVVSLAAPWGLSSSDASVYVGLYGRSADALVGLADVLTGEAAPGGSWPVGVDVPYDVCR